MIRDNGRPERPYVFGLEHVPLPAVICDECGQIFWANDRFLAASGSSEILEGACLGNFVTFERDASPLWESAKRTSGAEISADAVLGCAQYTLHMGQAGHLFSCVFSPKSHADVRSPAPAKVEECRNSQTPPTGDKLLEALLFLSHELHLTMGEEALLRLFVRTYEELFPTRWLCIRLFAPNGTATAHVYANGRLRPEMREMVQVTRAACTAQSLDDPERMDLLKQQNITVLDAYEPIFSDSWGGFDILLWDGTSLYGIVNFEYSADDALITADQPIAMPLAHQMCAALRNARLLTEATFLKDYLAKLLDCANAPVLVVDRNCRITVINQAFERQTGFKRTQLLKSDLMNLVPEEERVRLLPTVLAAMRGESASNIEVRIPRADGEGEAHVAFNTAVIQSRFGEPDGIIFVGQDLTEIRALQKQVIHSEKLATLGQVAAGVVHELNNPLTSISVYASYLKKKLASVIDESDTSKIGRISEAANRIQTFTRDLVAYARPASEEPKLINVSDMLRRAFSFCEHVVTESEADVVLDIAEDLAPIYGLQGQIEQVFVNLITNACHALPEMGGEIHISAQPIEKERIRVSVRDTGQGIPEDQLKEIFTPFFTTKPEGLGTGLGLSIVRNILVNHNAEIAVTSALGQGSTFAVTLYTR
ncbi:MAG: ATP-binding protein [Myxococcota bacterium]|nr:ATP-binding protein [Myxococcota bacterium]